MCSPAGPPLSAQEWRQRTAAERKQSKIWILALSRLNNTNLSYNILDIFHFKNIWNDPSIFSCGFKPSPFRRLHGRKLFRKILKYKKKNTLLSSRCGSAVRFGQALPGYLITAHHLHASLRWLSCYLCGGITKQKRSCVDSNQKKVLLIQLVLQNCAQTHEDGTWVHPNINLGLSTRHARSCHSLSEIPYFQEFCL